MTPTDVQEIYDTHMFAFMHGAHELTEEGHEQLLGAIRMLTGGNWTDDLPTEAGVFWCYDKRHGIATATVTSVVLLDGEWHAGYPFNPKPVSAMNNHRWFGPISPPPDLTT